MIQDASLTGKVTLVSIQASTLLARQLRPSKSSVQQQQAYEVLPLSCYAHRTQDIMYSVSTQR
eukprot:221748-Ditylum_brightwellii.AAC.1